MDITLKMGTGDQLLGLLHKGLCAAAGDISPLMKGNRAKITVAKTTPVMVNGEFHLLNGGNSSLLFVRRMVIPLVWQRKHLVQFLGRQGRHRGILDQQPFPMLLDQGRAGFIVLLVHLRSRSFGVGQLIFSHLLIGSTGDSSFGDLVRRP